MTCWGHPRWPGPKGAPGPTGPDEDEPPPPDPPDVVSRLELELVPEPEEDAVDDAPDPPELAPDDVIGLGEDDAAALTGICVCVGGAARRRALRARCTLRWAARARAR